MVPLSGSSVKLQSDVIRFQRKIVRRLNWKGLFLDVGDSPLPVAVVAGYTRSGTTFLGRVLSNVLSARPVHEPLNPAAARETAFFNERESLSTIRAEDRYQRALREVFSSGFKGTRLTNTGSRLTYHGHIVKVVRANHYIGYLSEFLDNCPFVIIVRNPCACIASRVRQNWPVPDYQHCFPDIEKHLSPEQVELYYTAETTITKLAVSWCLDNFMLFKNADRKNFLYVNYESVLSEPEREFSRILIHLGAEKSMARVNRELRLEWGSKAGQGYLDSWRALLGEGEVREIEKVLRVFGLDKYYDVRTGLPHMEDLSTS